ncbi:Uma2 family endonuclease [Lyngbya sp. CCAP 1446/10]|uniref:Uma2 family endonuclease n=1 Tax=Microcoleaceae TaxID=1892252 RepID=UPI002238961B|nr:Uma2 family endonuclease [Lyngbya sp. CCAP 1446/10]MCW6049507.1 Uma2 family endonuclease [Lyngbya sp. CCAP 1446/10]
MVTTTSTPVEHQTTPENRVILKSVSWSTFKALLADVGDDRAWRIAYDGGVLEIRMPLEEHEEPKRLIESFVEAIVDDLGIELRSLGSLTLEREDLTRAVEPDSCFYIQNESLVRGRNINLPNDPPPDLAIESDYTNSSVNKFTIYAALGVPEIWRYRRESLQVYQLVDGKYEMCDRSLAFPFLPVAEIPGFIEQSRTIGQRAAVRFFRQRIREILLSQK